MKDCTRVLFVDDEPAIRATMPPILTQFGFEVTAAASVPEALNLITTKEFDVLISDLNIGQPGDGFTVVSAMRRTQPNATTFILTGFPAFETALEAIRQQVDDYLVKPTDVKSLVEKIRSKLNSPQATIHRIEAKRLAEILDQNRAEIMHQWLREVKEDALIASTRLSDAELSDHLPSICAEMVNNLRGHKLSREAMKPAADHGRARFRQGCSVASIVRECGILQDVLSRFVQENLLGADISSLIPDIIRIGQTSQAFLEASIRAHMDARHSAAEILSQHKERAVLLIGPHLETALLRAYVLSHAGFAVSRAESREQALSLLHGKFDALVLSYSLPAENIVEMTGLFRQHNPQSPIIGVAKGKRQDLKIGADFAVTAEEGPEALIGAVDEALNRKQLRRIK